MDIELLKTFLEVSRTRHFGQAADNLYLTQSAVSARIRLLEQTVGVPLFTRTRNNIRLTPAGEKLVKHADSILNAWNRARQEIAIEESCQLPLAVGGVPSLWDILLQSWLNRLAKQHEKLSIHAEVHGTDLLVRRLLDGTIDLIFMFESLQMPELVVEQVAEINLVMVSATPNTNAVDAIKNNYVLVNWGTSFSIAHAQHFPDMPPPKLHVHLGRLALGYISECGGTAYLAHNMVEQELKSEQLFLVGDAPVIKRTAYAAYLPNSDQRSFITEALSMI